MASLTVSAPAFAFCSEPIKPSCASGGGRDLDTAGPECRSQFRNHLDDLEIYRDCLESRIREVTEEMQSLRKLLDLEKVEPQS